MLRNILLSAVALTIVGGTASFAQDADVSASAEKPAVQSRENRGIKRVDANKDGVITLDEFGSKRLENWKKADADGDGVLSAEELTDFIQKREVERRVKRLTRMLDVDGDGQVTLAELENQNEKRFALLDANNDGQISAEEMRRAHQFMGGKHRKFDRKHHGKQQGKRFHHRMHKGGNHAPANASPAENTAN